MSENTLTKTKLLNYPVHFETKDQTECINEKDHAFVLKRKPNDSHLNTCQQVNKRQRSECCTSSLRNIADSFIEETGKLKTTNNIEMKTNQLIMTNHAMSKNYIPRLLKKIDLIYYPSKNKYHPINDAVWKYKEKVPYYALAKTFEDIENISSHISIVETLSNYFRSVVVLSPACLLPSVYLCLNKLSSVKEGLELRLPYKYIMTAVSLYTGLSKKQIITKTQITGDIGIVAKKFPTKQPSLFLYEPSNLFVQDVFKKLTDIAKIVGPMSMKTKVEKIHALLVDCKDSELRFLLRFLEGKLRIGLAEQLVIQALALACSTTPPNQTYPPNVLNVSQYMSTKSFKRVVKENTSILKTCCCECPDYNKIISILLQEDFKNLSEKCKLVPGIPVKPMFARSAKGMYEVWQHMKKKTITCEMKYDGERIQIHLQEDTHISLYNKNQVNITLKYPDIVTKITKGKINEARSFILDCEVVAYDKINKQILPSSMLLKRKHKVSREEDININICIFMFDLLFLNGDILIQKSLGERRILLKRYFKESVGECEFAKSFDTASIDEAQEFLDTCQKDVEQI